MTLELDGRIEQLIHSRIQSGEYVSAEAVIHAAWQSLVQDESLGRFDNGEWDQLLTQAEQGGADLDGEVVLAEIGALRQADPKQ